MTKFFLSSSPAKLQAHLAQFGRTATVEAEYGDEVVPGSVLTMAHHGPRAGQQCPCSYPNGCAENIEAVGLSHFDLDSFGGCLAILWTKPEAPGFWRLAEFVDLNGPHKISQSGASEEDLRRLYAFWAWSEKNRLSPPRDGSVAEVTDYINHSITVIQEIIGGKGGHLEAGDAFKAAGEKLNADTFVDASDGAILRIGPSFVNHLYEAPDGEIARAVVGFNTLTGAVTVSFAEAPQGKNARDIVQEVFGDQAGGHAGIAGSPRGVRASFDGLHRTYELTRATLKAAE